MNSFQYQDMYDFVDDGVNKSIYTILNEYHPFLERDFSIASLINHIPDIKYINAGERIYIREYEDIVNGLSKLLLEKTAEMQASEADKSSDEKLDKIFEEFKAASENNIDCTLFSTISEFIDYSQRNITKPTCKGLRDAIVRNAVEYLTPEDVSKNRERLISLIYFTQAENQVKAVNPMRRDPGKYPEWDRMAAIKKIITRKDGLKEYDEFYEEATKEIKQAVLVAMEKAKTSSICKVKRGAHVKSALEPTKAAASKPSNSRTEELFEKLKRMPIKEENSWSFTSLKTPELLCDLQAEYSDKGFENQRVVAYRYGRFKYSKNQVENGGFYIDNTEVMPELVGISRIGKDGTKTYFVLMPPIDRIIYRPASDKTVNPGDRLLQFTVTQDVEVKTPSGRKVVQKQERPSDVVDGKTGKKVNVFRNKDIPEELEEFFAKVYFSDEYLSSVIENNARYLGSVEQTENGPVIHTFDADKLDLAAAHYATYFPGIVDKKLVKNLGSFCSSAELEIKQYNLINEREKALRKKSQSKTTKKKEGKSLDD